MRLICDGRGDAGFFSLLKTALFECRAYRRFTDAEYRNSADRKAIIDLRIESLDEMLRGARIKKKIIGRATDLVLRLDGDAVIEDSRVIRWIPGKRGAVVRADEFNFGGC